MFNQIISVGDSWSISSDLDTVDSFIISCSNIVEETFLGVTDSVKVFEVQAIKDGEMINHEFNSTQFKLSKKHGFIKFPFFNSMINAKHHIYNEPYLTYDIIGFQKDNEQYGFQNDFDVYFGDFNVGDIYFYESKVGGFFNGQSWFSDTYIWDSITQVIDTPDTLFVIANTYVEQISENPAYPLDTVFKLIEGNCHAYSKAYYNNKFHKATQTYDEIGNLHAPSINSFGRMVETTDYVELRINGDCEVFILGAIQFPPPRNSTICEEGLGLILYENFPFKEPIPFGDNLKVRLECFKKNGLLSDIDCREFLADQFVSEEEEEPTIDESNLEFSLGPNPVIGNAIITFSPVFFSGNKPLPEVKIYDHIGNEVFYQKSETAILEINTMSFARGLFFIEVKSEENRFIQRFLKH